MNRMNTAIPVELSERASQHYAQHVNPEWVRLLDLLQMNVRYERCVGTELFTDDGRRILDFLSGYCVHNVGHNHPEVVRALQNELERCGPAMIQTHVADLAGELAEKLCDRAGGRLARLSFALREARPWNQRSMFGQIVVMRLFRDFGFLTQICGNHFMVLKLAPPLVVTDAQLDAFVVAIRDVVEIARSPGLFWSEALGLAVRAFRS